MVSWGTPHPGAGAARGRQDWAWGTFEEAAHLRGLARVVAEGVVRRQARGPLWAVEYISQFNS